MLSRVHLTFHARIQDFSSGGRGVGPGQSDKKSPDVFLSPQHILLKSNGTIIFQGSRGGPIFSRGGGVQLVPRGSNCLYPIETLITCDFPGGSGPPDPPLDLHLPSRSAGDSFFSV